MNIKNNGFLLNLFYILIGLELAPIRPHEPLRIRTI